MKYKIKHIGMPTEHGICENFLAGAEIELEPLEDCPASECELASKEMGKRIEEVLVKGKPKEPNEYTDRVSIDSVMYQKCDNDDTNKSLESISVEEMFPDESLEEKIRKLIDERQFKGTFILESELAQIAKEHFQNNPKEIGCINRRLYDAEVTLNKHLDEEMGGMVKLSEVLRVFDDAVDELFDEKVIKCDSTYHHTCYFLRQAIENMGNK